MLVDLIYFRLSGKYYSSGSYMTNKENLGEIWEEVRGMQQTKNLPGLMTGHSEFHISIDVPDYPYNHPHLILAE